MSNVDLSFLRNGMCEIGAYQASFILKYMNYPLNRKQDSRVVKSYKEAMMEGNWMRPIDISFVAVPVDTVPSKFKSGIGRIKNWQYFLVNGQHRLQAVWDSNTQQTANVTILNVEHWDDIGKIYSSFDTDIRKRTTSQILAAANVTPILNAKYRNSVYKNNALRAMAYIVNRFELVNPTLYSVSISSPKLLDEMAGWEDELIEYFDIVSSIDSTSHRKYLGAPIIIALGIITLRNNHGNAINFWRGVADRSNLHPDDPRKVLADWIDDNYKKTNEAPVTANKRKCFAISEAWNRYYEGREMNRRTLLGIINKRMKQPVFGFTLKDCYASEGNSST